MEDNSTENNDIENRKIGSPPAENNATESSEVEGIVSETNKMESNVIENNEIKVSIIIPAKNEGANVKMTVESIINSSSSILYEVIVIDDGSEDDCCRFLLENENYWQENGVKLFRTDGLGSSNARNFGASHAKGDILIFSDAHVTVEKGWMEKIVATISQPGIDVLVPGIADYGNPAAVGYGQTWSEKLEVAWLPAPQEVRSVPIAPSGLVAVKKEVFHSVGGFEKGFKIWGYEDVEFSLKCWLFGFNVYATPEVIVKHIFRKRHVYFVSTKEVNYNLIRMAVSHFSRERLAKTLNMIKTTPSVEMILAEIAVSDSWEQRKEYFNKRKYDDDWFMNKFQIPY
ncbi:MAG: glycosyltransferase [Eubacteriales bacterium]